MTQYLLLIKNNQFNTQSRIVLKKIMPYDVIIKRPYHKIRGWIAQRQVSKLMHRRS